MAASHPPPSTELLDSLDTVVWEADAATLRCSYVNRGGAATLGYRPEQWLEDEQFWPNLLHGQDREEMLALCAEVARDGVPRERTHRITDARGTIRWFRTKVRFRPPLDGAGGALTGEMVEVTEFLREKERIDRDQRWLRLMLEQVPAIIWTLDRELRFTSGAGAGLARVGLRPNQALGQRLSDFLGVADPEGPQLSEHLRALKGEAVHYAGHWAGRKYDSYVEPLRDADGSIIGVIGLALDITERREAEEQRRTSERRFQHIVETADEGIWTLDPDWKTTFVNSRMAAMLGYTPDEMLGRSVFDFMDQERAADVAGNLRRRRAGLREHSTAQLRRRDGSELWIDVASSPLFDEEGRFMGALAMVSDLTRQREAEAERERLLRETNARRELLELVLQHVPSGILLLRGADFVVELANPACHAMAPGKTIEGRRWYDDVMPELAAAVRPQVEEVMRTGRPIHLVDAPMQVRRSPEGPLEQAWFTSSRVPVRLPGGEPGMLLLFTETTATVRARREIERLAGVSREQAVQLKAILDNMADGVVSFDQTGRVAFISRGSEEQFGTTAANLQGRTIPEFLKLVDARDGAGRPVSEENAVSVRTLAGERVLGQDMSIGQVDSGRRLIVRISSMPLRDVQGSVIGALLVLRNVTEVVEFERLKDQFIGVAAHELKTPVAIMKANAQLLLTTADELTDSHRRMAAAIDRGANRIDKIIQDLLDISQLQLDRLTLTRTEVELLQLVQQVTQRIAAHAPRHQFQLEHSDPGVIETDPHRLEWIVTHLLDNAVRYSPQGGLIRVRVEQRPGEAIISVQDQGVGIPRERQARIFERFYRAHVGTPDDFGGLGVSLHLSREILQRLGGQLWFESEPGKGTTFFVRLPRGPVHGREADRAHPGR